MTGLAAQYFLLIRFLIPPLRILSFSYFSSLSLRFRIFTFFWTNVQGSHLDIIYPNSNSQVIRSGIILFFFCPNKIRMTVIWIYPLLKVCYRDNENHSLSRAYRAIAQKSRKLFITFLSLTSHQHNRTWNIELPIFY